MASITLKGKPIKTAGDLPKVGSKAPDFSLVKQDLSEATLNTYAGKDFKILNIFPSVDTPVCAMSVKKFFEKAGKSGKAVVLNISMDLPFATKRFCAAEGVEGTESLSAFRSTFAKDYHVEIMDPPLKGLCSRAIVVLDKDNKVLYTEQVPEIAQEPDYDKALSYVK